MNKPVQMSGDWMFIGMLLMIAAVLATNVWFFLGSMGAFILMPPWGKEP